MKILALTLALAFGCPVHAAPGKRAPACKRTQWRYIGHERVPWDHSEDDHEWDEFDHTTDECEPPPC